MTEFIYLALAVLSEVIGTSALKVSAGFTKLWPSLLMVGCYALTFFLMSQVVKRIPIGTVYAIWSGLGTVGIVLVGVLFLNEKINLWGVVGIALIVAGVVILNLFTSSHA